MKPLSPSLPPQLVSFPLSPQLARLLFFFLWCATLASVAAADGAKVFLLPRVALSGHAQALGLWLRLLFLLFLLLTMMRRWRGREALRLPVLLLLLLRVRASRTRALKSCSLSSYNSI